MKTLLLVACGWALAAAAATGQTLKIGVVADGVYRIEAADWLSLIHI